MTLQHLLNTVSSSSPRLFHAVPSETSHGYRSGHLHPRHPPGTIAGCGLKVTWRITAMCHELICEMCQVRWMLRALHTRDLGPWSRRRYFTGRIYMNLSSVSSVEQWAVAVQLPGTRSTSSSEHLVEGTDRIKSLAYTFLIEATPPRHCAANTSSL